MITAGRPIQDVTFDPETHRYTLGHAILPSVTQVINDLLPGWQASRWHMDRGTAMHYGCALLDEGRLDWSTVAPEIEGRVRAWEKFRAEFAAPVLACELSLAHPLYRFAGTLDRAFAAGNTAVIADIKSTICPQVKLQLGGYRLLWSNYAGRHGRKITRAVAVELSDDGTYRTLWLDSSELKRGEQAFLAALTLFNFKRKEHLK